ncbi:hypothetical protein HDV00_009434 [Rhizophlyctis rosea]|nr:hypothetical protein HDV00_009434 [Rhizophlyctis rosea]
MKFITATLAASALSLVSAATISTDFEGGIPSGWSTVVSSSGGSAVLDSSKAHSGSNSIKVTSSGGYANHVFFGLSDISSVKAGGDIYGRYWANFQTALTQDHVTFMSMDDPVATNLRMGGQFGVVDWNRASDDSIMPDGSPQSIAASTAITAGKWTCFEFHLSPSTGQIETWIDGAAISGLTTPQSRWGSSYKPNPSSWGLGWESYGSGANTIWYDDLALSNSRIGCSGTGGSTGGATTTTTRTTTTTTTTRPPTTTTTTTRPITTTTQNNNGGQCTVTVPGQDITVTQTAPASTVYVTAGQQQQTTTTTRATTTTTQGGSTGSCAAKYAQCGGQGFSGPTCCQSGSTCKASNQYYSQCL